LTYFIGRLNILSISSCIITEKLDQLKDSCGSFKSAWMKLIVE